MTIAALGLFTAVTWPGVPLAIAMLSNEQKPILLGDIQWKGPESDTAFRAQFHASVREAELLSWLAQNGFATNRPRREVQRIFHAIPCAERAEVRWWAEGGVLRDARATVAEAGCL